MPGITHKDREMPCDRDSDGTGSPDWVYISSPDYNSPGHTYLRLSPLSVMSPSVSNRDISTVTPPTSPNSSPERSTVVEHESPASLRLRIPLFGKIEFSCKDCASPPGRYIRNTIHTNRISNTSEFTLLESEDQVGGLARNSGHAGPFSIVGMETPNIEETWRTKAAISALNMDPRALAMAGYGPEDVPPDHLWFGIEPYLRRHSFCRYCFLVFVKYGPATRVPGVWDSKPE
ncbi:hypothetical protein TWF281_001707 [Arthrobotrys megalospora]